MSTFVQAAAGKVAPLQVADPACKVGFPSIRGSTLGPLQLGIAALRESPPELAEKKVSAPKG